MLPPGLGAAAPHHAGGHVPFGMSAQAWGWTVRGIVTVLLALLGLTVETSQFNSVVRPSRDGPFVPFICTLACLILIMPAVAYGLARAFELQSAEALGFLLWAVAPGGAFSNMVSATARANVALNAALTCASVFVAIGMLPLACEFVIPSLLAAADSKPPPVDELLLNIVFIALPLLGGVCASRWLPKVSRVARRTAGPAGLLFILTITLLQGLRAPSWRAVAAAQVFFLVAFTLGLGLGLGLGQPADVVKSMVLEMAVHDTPLAQTVFLSTYHARLSDDESATCMTTIYVCGLGALGWSLLGVGVILGSRLIASGRIRAASTRIPCGATAFVTEGSTTSLLVNQPAEIAAVPLPLPAEEEA